MLKTSKSLETTAAVSQPPPSSAIYTSPTATTSTTSASIPVLEPGQEAAPPTCAESPTDRLPELKPAPAQEESDSKDQHDKDSKKGPQSDREANSGQLDDENQSQAGYFGNNRSRFFRMSIWNPTFSPHFKTLFFQLQHNYINYRFVRSFHLYMPSMLHSISTLTVYLS